jgi:hypothetical protein
MADDHRNPFKEFRSWPRSTALTSLIASDADTNCAQPTPEPRAWLTRPPNRPHQNVLTESTPNGPITG